MKFRNTRYGGFSAQAFQMLREKRKDKNIVLEFVHMTHSLTGRHRIEPVTSVYAVTPFNADGDKTASVALLQQQFADYADYGPIRSAGYHDVSGIKTYGGLIGFTQKLGVDLPEKKRAFPTYKPHRNTPPIIRKKRKLLNCSVF